MKLSLLFILMISVLSSGNMNYRVLTNQDSNYTTNSQTVSVIKSTPNSKSNYIERGPIFINSNADFQALDIPGNGTMTNPFIIDGYNISSTQSTLIHIQDTFVHFKITNNILDGLKGGDYPSEDFYGNWSGIYLENVIHGRIENNIIRNSNYGILLQDSANNNSVTNNSIYHCYNPGIKVDSSMNNIIQGNIINDTSAFYLLYSSYNMIYNNSIYNVLGDGIYMHESDNNILSYNILFNNSNNCIDMYECHNNIVNHNWLYYSQVAISIWHSSRYNTITNNTIFNHSFCGIDIRSANFNTVSNNIIHNCSEMGINISGKENKILNNIIFNNSDDGIVIGGGKRNSLCRNLIYYHLSCGIRFWGTDENLVCNNTLYQNGYGIILHYGVNNTIKWNDFIENINGISQAKVRDQNNIVTQNYWNDWAGPDKNGDRIVDQPYVIEGGTGIKDRYPQTAPNNPPLTDYFTGEEFNYSVATAEIKGTSFFPSLAFGVLVVFVVLGILALERSQGNIQNEVILWDQ